MKEQIAEARRAALRRLVGLLAMDPDAPGVSDRVAAALWVVDHRTRVPFPGGGHAGDRFRNLLQILLPPGAPFVAESASQVLVEAERWDGDRGRLGELLLALIDGTDR